MSAVKTVNLSVIIMKIRGDRLNIWNIAIYTRVSTDKEEQSESISAQIQSLKKWISDKSQKDKNDIYNIKKIYEDQGFSGSNFERDSFKKMKEDIECGKINMVVTRDLSRFARNYIVAGYYLEDYFKKKGIRFISTLDNVDTIYEVDDIVPFKNILNEMYIKDCSKRTRDGLKQRMIRGSSIASKPPYGYNFEKKYKDDFKDITLIPANDGTADIVKEIFNLYLEGWGMAKIATYLNKKGVDPPSARIKNFSKSKFGLWSNNTIRYILTNPKYAGIMVQGRWKKVSYKIKMVKPTVKEEWIIGRKFKGIISKECFDRVQELMKKRSKNFRYKKGKIHLFSGILKCNECGGSMTYRSKYKGYKCLNSQKGNGVCTAHSIKEEYLIQIIKNDLKKRKYKEFNLIEFYKELNKRIDEKYNCIENIEKIKGKLKKIDWQFEKIYMDNLNGVINKRNFEFLIKKIEKKQKLLINEKERMENKKIRYKEKKILYDTYKKEILRILNFEEFDRATIEHLIDKIIVKEDKKNKEKRVEIYYRFKE